MKTKLKIAFTGLLLTFLITSCGCNRFLNEERSIDQKPQCGFGEEVGIENEHIQTPATVKVSPAADRGNMVSSPVTEDLNPNISSPSKSITEEVEDSKKRREETSIGNKKRKRFKSIVKAVKEHKKNRDGGVGMTILLVILAILLPPLAVGIFEGITWRFWLVLVLWLLGIGLLAWLLPGLFYIGGLVAIIMALLIVLGVW
jgi:uncharacterized membrane protein YqaE (UPF0057 family)